MSETFPDDVMKAARAAVDEMPQRPPFKSDVEEAIARAIAAERERCAKIAEDYRPLMVDYYRYPHGANIAARIRGTNESA